MRYIVPLLTCLLACATSTLATRSMPFEAAPAR